MRICFDNKDDPHFDPRPRRVWSNDTEVTEPVALADEFRRVVILVNGKVLNGAVFIERFKDNGESEGAPSRNIDAGFSGVLVHTPDTPNKPGEPEKVSTGFQSVFPTTKKGHKRK